MPAGMSRARWASLMARTASDSDPPGARLNDIVTAGNCPIRLMTCVAWPSDTLTRLEIATGLPAVVCTKIESSALASRLNWGATSTTTRYWLDCVKIVDAWR